MVRIRTTRNLKARCIVIVCVLLCSATALADYTPILDGDISEWNSFPAYIDLRESGPPQADIISVWASDDNTSGSNGYLYVGMEFAGKIKKTTQGGHLSVIQMTINTDDDGANDFVVLYVVGGMSGRDAHHAVLRAIAVTH